MCYIALSSMLVVCFLPCQIKQVPFDADIPPFLITCAEIKNHNQSISRTFIDMFHLNILHNEEEQQYKIPLAPSM